jgi:Cytochrome P460
MSYRISVIVLAVVIVLSYQHVMSQSKSIYDGFDLVDKTGNIRKPSDYRDRYQVLGTYTVLDPIPMVTGASGEAKKENEMHVVYAPPGTAEYYRKNGRFADGTVLVKEVFGTDHAQMTTGDSHWASGTKQWFIMIKDAKGRYPGNPLWGNGWGWALYKSDAPDKQVATDYKRDCLGCHIPAQATDWIYVQGYPVLAAK